MNRRGFKRPLPCAASTTASPYSGVGSEPGDDGRGVEATSCSLPRPRNPSLPQQQHQQEVDQEQQPPTPPPPPQQQQQHRRKRSPAILHQQEGRRPECCGCRRRRNGPSSTLRLAGVVGIQFLGLMACPCPGFGFTTPGLNAGGAALTPDESARTAAGNFECRASFGSGGGGSGSGSSSSDRDTTAGSRSGAAGAGGARRRPPRDRRAGGGGVGGPWWTACDATRLPSAEEGPRLGLLYDRALLKAGISQGQGPDTGTGSPTRTDGNAVPGAGGSSSSGGTGAEVGWAMGPGRDGEDGGGPLASAAAAAAAAAGTVVEAERAEAEATVRLPTDNSNGVTMVQNVTAQWTGVVNGAATPAAGEATATATATATVAAAAAATTTDAAAVVAATPAARRKKWSGKGWLASRAEEKEKEEDRQQRPQQGETGVGESSSSPPVLTASTAQEPATADGGRSASSETDSSSGLDGINGFAAAAEGVETERSGCTAGAGSDSGRVVVEAGAGAATAAAAAGNLTAPTVAGCVPVVEGQGVENSTLVQQQQQQQPPEGEPRIESEKGGGHTEVDICTAAREELTVYLLETGATSDLVATATTALFAAEPRCSLTEGTWKRWRQNLDGLRSTGFTGSDVANMLALCPQLLAIDYEGQVVPTMELLRQLGMRPTDVRRVIRKAPEVLAPRADGSTSAEAVDVLFALGLQTRHVKMEALRWPQLLAVPPGSFFQLAAFLASEEVGIKAANIASLIRQAPWLVLQPIDGQMLPVARFLRIAGVTDVERIVRAYPKVLCASIKGELAPRVRFLWSDVGLSEEDLPRVLQTFPLLLALPLSRMQDVLSFLAEELTINRKDTAKIIRAFPSLLGLERERHMDGVVRYLKSLGVQNVGRFVSRLPPVLGYDVNTNLAPKMDYLVENMGLSVYDVLTFPAYFSYPLDTVIEPRTEFLNIRGRPITLVGLNIALQQGDADFARKVAKVQPRVYREFKEAYMDNRAAVKSGQRDAESLLSVPQRKAIGNLGGQSTSNNVSEVTARATGLPPKRQQPQRPSPPPPSPPRQQQEQQRPREKDSQG